MIKPENGSDMVHHLSPATKINSRPEKGDGLVQTQGGPHFKVRFPRTGRDVPSVSHTTRRTHVKGDSLIIIHMLNNMLSAGSSGTNGICAENEKSAS